MSKDNGMTDEERIHMENALRVMDEEQAKDAIGLVNKIMDMCKRHIYEAQNAPVNRLELLAMFRLRVLVQMQYFLEAGGNLEREMGPKGEGGVQRVNH